MGFTCCTLKLWTTIAVIYSIINYLVFTGADFFILLSIVTPSVFLFNHEANSWSQFVNSFNKMDNVSILLGIILIRLILRLFLIISVPILSIGNRRDRRRYLIPWEIIVAIYTAALIASSIYFLIDQNKDGFINEFHTWIKSDLSQLDAETSIQWTRLTLLLNLSDGGPLILFWLILLSCVHLRCAQIRYEKNQLRRLGQWNTNILTYRIPRARLNSIDQPNLDSTLEMRSSRIPVYPTTMGSATLKSTDSRSPYYDNQAFKY